MKEINISSTEQLYEAIKTTGPKRLMLSEGVFEINKTIALSDNTEIIGKGDKTVLTGTKRITFAPSDKLIEIDLKKKGIEDVGAFGLGPFADFWREYDIPKPYMTEYGPSLQLYFNGRSMNLSRYPKSGFMRIKKATGQTTFEFNGEPAGAMEGTFIPSDTTPFEENNIKDLLLVGYWKHDWATQRHTVASYNPETKEVEVEKPYHSYGYRDGKCFTGEIGGKFYVLNVKSTVNKPGDWYIDRQNKKLYLYPYKNQDYVDISVCENIFEANNRTDITIKNLNIHQTRKNAVVMNNCSNVTLSGLNICEAGAWGILCDNAYKTKISSCHISNTGGGGLSCTGGDRNTLTSSENSVIGNTVHDIAYWHKTYMPAINISGVNIIVAENKLYDLPHFAISFQGNNHIIEKNEISNVCYESNDSGAIYAGRDWTCQGNIIRYNYIHDLYGFDNAGCIGIYFDDGLSSASVYGNILANIPYVAILLGGGRGFDIHDNKFFNCNMALMFDQRINTWKHAYDGIRKHLDEVPYRSEIWKRNYPLLHKILDDEPKLPKYNSFKNNTVVCSNGLALSHPEIEQYLDMENNTFVKTENTPEKILHLMDWYYID